MDILIDNMNHEEMAKLLRMARERPCSDPVHEKIISIATIAVQRAAALQAENAYYRDIVDSCCNIIDHRRKSGTPFIVCGTVDDPTTELQDAVLSVAEERDRLQAENERLETDMRKFYNLLAVIHRDGGHYRDEHGLDKASEDAMKIVIDERISKGL